MNKNQIGNFQKLLFSLLSLELKSDLIKTFILVLEHNYKVYILGGV